MVAQWNNFTNYIVGDQVQNGSSLIYGCLLANKNQAPPNITYWNPLTPAGGGNIVSVNGLTNPDITLFSADINFTPNPVNGDIELAVAFPPAVLYIVTPDNNSASNGVAFTSDGGTVTITGSGDTINFESGGGSGVSQIIANGDSVFGNVTFTSVDSSIAFTASGGDTLDLAVVPLPSVIRLNTLQNDVTLTSQSIIFTPNSNLGTIDLAVSYPPSVTKLNTLQNDITLKSANSTVVITEGANDINFEVANGLFMTAITADAVVYTGNVGFQSTGGTVAFSDGGGGALNFEATPIVSGVSGIQVAGSVTLSGVVNVTSSNGTISITNPASSNDLDITTPLHQFFTKSGGGLAGQSSWTFSIPDMTVDGLAIVQWCDPTAAVMPLIQNIVYNNGSITVTPADYPQTLPAPPLAQTFTSASVINVWVLSYA